MTEQNLETCEFYLRLALVHERDGPLDAAWVCPEAATVWLAYRCPRILPSGSAAPVRSRLQARGRNDSTGSHWISVTLSAHK